MSDKLTLIGEQAAKNLVAERDRLAAENAELRESIKLAHAVKQGEEIAKLKKELAVLAKELDLTCAASDLAAVNCKLAIAVEALRYFNDNNRLHWDRNVATKALEEIGQ